MGISGLLPLLKSIHRQTELKKYAGETFAVDAYGWLHRGAIACAMDLAQGKPTRKYVDFAMHRVRMFKYFGVTPYLVFDGDYLPSKALTEASREKRREDTKKAGLELLKAGKPSQAYQELQKAIDVTPEMARHLIEELKKHNIPYVVAPYEADAQMVYLERQGIVSGIVSEDSDLLVFGCKRLLTKLDQHGKCVEINRRDFCAVREISLTGWTDAEFRQMAIMSGCDYLQGIGNLGLKTAYRMMRKYKTPEKVLRMLQFDGKYKISENYLAAFKQAELTFLHQRVFCPKKQDIVLLTECTSGLDVEEMPFIGAKVSRELSQAIAVGDVNPITKQPIIMTGVANKQFNKTKPVSAGAQNKPPAKPIDSFFKAKGRIPMGAMDPNCFAVDPQAVAALTNNGLTPRVFPLPRPYLDETRARQSLGNPWPAAESSASAAQRAQRAQRRKTEPVLPSTRTSNPSSTPSSSRRVRGQLPNAVDSISYTPRPAKKARLCGEASFGADTTQELEHSKFFPMAQSSTSKISTPKTKRNRDSHISIMSDDSIDDALLSLPDFDDWNLSRSARSSQSLSVYQDDTQITIPDDCEEVLAKSVDDDKVEEDIEVPASSPLAATAPQEPSQEVVLESPPKVSIKTFSYTPSISAGKARFAHGLPTPASSTQGSVTRPSAATRSASTPLLTPLQRIGARALQQDKRRSSPFSMSQKRSTTSSQKSRASVKPAVPSFPVEASAVPLPKVSLEEVEALNRPLGSEDQIIPDSDGEHEIDSENQEAGKVPGDNSERLDLSQFLYH